MQQPSHHLNTIQQQNQSDSDEINNCSDDRNSNSNDIDADNDAMMESDPDAAAELLRQKIEETNQKISDYFRQQ